MQHMRREQGCVRGMRAPNTERKGGNAFTRFFLSAVCGVHVGVRGASLSLSLFRFSLFAPVCTGPRRAPRGPGWVRRRLRHPSGRREARIPLRGAEIGPPPRGYQNPLRARAREGTILVVKPG